MENIPLYNSVLLAAFMDLVKAQYPHVNTRILLEYAKISPYELEDKGHWFTQAQVDSFYEYLVKATENQDIAREAGRFVIQSKSADTLKQYTSAFVTPRVAYWAIGKIASTVSRHINIDVKPIAGNKIALIATSKEGIKEKPYQCENRIGLFEGLGKIFTGEYSIIEHSECMHKGNASCKYVVSWKRTPATIWKLARGYSSLLSVILLISLFLFLPFQSWIISLLIVSLVLVSIFFVSEKMTNIDLNVSVEGQKNITEKYIKQLEIRYNELALIKEIGEAASSIFDPNELLNFVTDALQKRLQFDRGMIMLANPEKTKLIYCSGYGYAPQEEALLRSANFDLTNPRSKGVFYLAYKNQKPFLVDNVHDIEQDISERTANFIKNFGINSFICVPIIYEGSSEGILAVDNNKTNNQPNQSDLSLLLGIAQQVGISLNNTLAHKKIKASEERFRNLSDNSPDIIYQLDVEGRIKYANPAWKEILGHSIEDDLKNRHLADFLLNEDRPAFNATIQNILSKKLTIRDKNFTVLNKKQLPRYVTFTGTPDCDAEGNVSGVVGTLKDITDRKQAQEALRESEERYRNILEEMDEAYYEVDLNGNFTFFNESMCETLGYSRVELMGMNNRVYVSPEHARKAFLTSNEVYRTGIPTTMTDYEVIRKNGEKRTLETSFSAIKKSSGEIIGFRGVARDVTERIRAEEDKLLLQERLQQADKMDAIGTLAGGIAHDFNNLLMGMQGYASMTLRTLKQSDPNYERLKRIEDQVRSGADLTSQLLGFARGGRYEVKTTNMNEILEKASSMFGRTKKEISFHRKLAKNLWNVEVDRGQMEQVFMNLYVNSWQAMPGGGNIYLETRNVLLDDEKTFPYLVKPGKYVKIKVSDTGTGMDEKTKEKIFEPFFTTKTMGRGTGLGLATVYGIIKGHQGVINVESEPGHGTTFTIYLLASEKELQKEEIPTGEIVTGTETILLVDDEEMVMEVNKELLESMGYTIYTAGSGKEGIAVYMEKKDKIDLIILDMIMPGISGSETFDRLREINPEIKVLLSSGYSLKGEAQIIMDRGCDGFLQKPFRLEELSGKVREMLS